MSDSTPVFLRRHQVEARVGLKRSAIYKQMSLGTFPRPVRLNGKAVAWLESEIIAWQQAQIEASRKAAA